MDGEQRRPGAVPRPGDPRSGGPRPAGTWRDAAWLSLSAGLVVLTAVQFVVMAVTLFRVELTTSTVRLFLGFLITVVWLLTIYWFAMGAWRRTVWGCPFEHTHDGPVERRCERHALVRV